jgi:hypothetical protein
LHPNANWPHGTPISIHFNATTASGEDWSLAKAYQFLSTLFTASFTSANEAGYSLEEVQNTLLGRGYGKTMARVWFGNIEFLNNTDADALVFEVIHPNYN